MITLLLAGYWTVWNVDWDKNRYNILLEDPKTGNVVATHKDRDPPVEGQTVYWQGKVDCEKTMEVLEGHGLRGTAWCAEDDWYLNRDGVLTCNAVGE